MVAATDPLLLHYNRMLAAKTPLDFVRAWSKYMLYVDPESVEGKWAKEAAEEIERLRVLVNVYRDQRQDLGNGERTT